MEYFGPAKCFHIHKGEPKAHARTTIGRGAASSAASGRGNGAPRPSRDVWIADLSAGASISAKQGGRRRGDSRRSLQGLQEGWSLPRRLRTVVVDLSNYLQRGDVASQNGQVSAIAGGRGA